MTAPSSSRRGTRAALCCSAMCSGVRLCSVRAARSAPASTRTRTTSPCPSATATCRGVQPPWPARSTPRPSRPVEDPTACRTVSTSPAAISRPSRWEVMRVVIRRSPLSGCWEGTRRYAGSDGVAPYGQERAQDGRHQTVTDEQETALPGLEELRPLEGGGERLECSTRHPLVGAHGRRDRADDRLDDEQVDQPPDDGAHLVTEQRAEADPDHRVDDEREAGHGQRREVVTVQR